MPTSGTASYSGIVYGTAQTQAIGTFSVGIYDIYGTSNLTANFSNSTLTTNLTFKGSTVANTNGLVSGVSSTTLTGTGTIGSPGYQNGISTGGDAGTFYGTLSGINNCNCSFSGRFYGPNAQEYGYNFSVTANGFIAAGVAIGKK